MFRIKIYMINPFGSDAGHDAGANSSTKGATALGPCRRWYGPTKLCSTVVQNNFNLKILSDSSMNGSAFLQR